MVIDGRTVEVGDIFFNGHYYRRVALIFSERIRFIHGSSNLVDARSYTLDGYNWSEARIKIERWEFVEHWNPTEAKDENGEIIHIGGWVRNFDYGDCKVINVSYVENVINLCNRCGYEVYMIDRNNRSYILAAKDCKVTPDPTIKPKINITVSVNKQPYYGKLSAKTLRDMGILEE